MNVRELQANILDILKESCEYVTSLTIIVYHVGAGILNWKLPNLLHINLLIGETYTNEKMEWFLNNNQQLQSVTFSFNFNISPIFNVYYGALSRVKQFCLRILVVQVDTRLKVPPKLCSNLEILTLDNHVDDHVISSFNAPNLKEVKYQLPQITNIEIQILAIRSPLIEILDLSYAQKINDSCIEYIIENLIHLREFFIHQCKNITISVVGMILTKSMVINTYCGFFKDPKDLHLPIKDGFELKSREILLYYVCVLFNLFFIYSCGSY